MNSLTMPYHRGKLKLGKKIEGAPRAWHDNWARRIHETKWLRRDLVDALRLSTLRPSLFPLSSESCADQTENTGTEEEQGDGLGDRVTMAAFAMPAAPTNNPAAKPAK